MEFDTSKHTVHAAKPLPVFLLLDASGSMNIVVDPENVRGTGNIFQSDGQTVEEVEGGTTKMQILNDAVKRMIDSFAAEERLEAEFQVSVITFGDEARTHLPPAAASSVQWTGMEAGGHTAMGAAFSLVKKAIEDRNVVPSRAYRPMVVLVSDGEPTDSWENPLNALISDGRSSKCFFMAMGIGAEPGLKTLERFISKTPFLAEVNGQKIPNTVFRAADAEKIHEFFRKLTMSATTRSKSQDPNNIPSSNSTEDDEIFY